jgi:hypothetical protein
MDDLSRKGVGREAQEESGGLKGERREERRERREERREMSGMIQIVISIFDILFVSHILPVL